MTRGGFRKRTGTYSPMLARVRAERIKEARERRIRIARLKKARKRTRKKRNIFGFRI